MWYVKFFEYNKKGFIYFFGSVYYECVGLVSLCVLIFWCVFMNIGGFFFIIK